MTTTSMGPPPLPGPSRLSKDVDPQPQLLPLPLLPRRQETASQSSTPTMSHPPPPSNGVSSYPAQDVTRKLTFASPEIQALSKSRSSALRLPDIAHHYAQKRRVRLPYSRSRAAMLAAGDDQDPEVIAQHYMSSTVPEPRNADLFLAYLQENDASTADISLFNDVDWEPCPSWDFAYTNGYQLSEDMREVDFRRRQQGTEWGKRSTYAEMKKGKAMDELHGTRRGCSCGSGDDGIDECDPATCECAKLHQAMLASDVAPFQDGDIFPYTIRGQIQEDLHAWSDVPFFECTDACGCGPSCQNRVVQKGRKVPLEIFKTPKCGWGIRSRQALKAGTFVISYGGELVSNSEAEERAKLYERDITTSYILDLESYYPNVAARAKMERAFPHQPQATEEDMDELENLWNSTDEGKTYNLSVDAGHWGNISRFFNHSCDPNLHVVYVWTDTVFDLARPWAAFFTRRNVPAGQELTFSYKSQPDDDEAEQIKREMDASQRGEAVLNGGRKLVAARCHCGTAKCNGIIWDDPGDRQVAVAPTVVVMDEDEEGGGEGGSGSTSEVPTGSDGGARMQRQSSHSSSLGGLSPVPGPTRFSASNGRSLKAHGYNSPGSSRPPPTTKPRWLGGSTKGCDFYIDMTRDDG